MTRPGPLRPDELCFPEPLADDPTPAQPLESRGAWLRRSTWDRARDTRLFYNTNLAILPAPVAAGLCRRLHRDTSEATHFELVVGRFLQVLGAEIEYEVEGAPGRKLDWLAHFPDGVVNVEATAPVANSVVGETYKAALPVIDIVMPLVPPGWHVAFAEIPAFGPAESKRWFKAAARELLADVPAGRPGARHVIGHEFPNGTLELHLFGRSDARAPSAIGVWPGVAYVDNTELVVRRAIEGKRAQARGARAPVLAALYTGGFGSHEDEKFDIPLFGRTVEHLWSGEHSFNPSGVFGGGHGSPTFAGALAFANLGMRGGPDPILYIHPRFGGSLPAALMSLERRELSVNGINRASSTSADRLALLEWPTA